MTKTSIINRLILLAAGHGAGYQIIKGMEPFSHAATFFLTVSFGILLLSCLLLMLFGLEILNNKAVIILASIIPLTLSQALVITYLPSVAEFNLLFIISAFGLAIYSILKIAPAKASVILAFVHGISGLVIVVLPVILVIKGVASGKLLWISGGGTIIGITGLLLMSVKIKHPLLSRDSIYNLLPLTLLTVTLILVMGLSAV